MNKEQSDFLFPVLERLAGPVPASERMAVEERASVLQLDRNAFLVRSGERQGRIGIVYQGVLKVVADDEGGNERIVNFRLEGDVTGIYTPYFEKTGEETWFSVQALTDCVIINLNSAAYDQLKKRHTFWSEVENKIFFEHYLEMENRVRTLLLDDAMTRYLNFKRDYPGLEQRISLHQIAAYLGISPISLSRIRSRIGKGSSP